MEYQEEWNYDDYEEDIPKTNTNYKYLYNTDNQKRNYTTNILSPSNYTQRLNIKSRQKLTLDNKILNSNYNTQKNYNYNKTSPIVNNFQLNPNSSQYYSQKNKYLITFNSNPRKFDSNGNISSDGVIRGYTSNCSFYVSGSSDLKANINYQNKDYKNTTKKENGNKSFNKAIEKTYIDTNKNIANINNYNRYINKNNYATKEVGTKKDNKTYKSSTETNYGQYKYIIPINLNNIKEQKPKINYTQTEPSNNVIYFSKNTGNSPSINNKYNSNYNNDKYNNKNNYYYNPNINNSNINQKKEYKTSTNINLNENTRKNYFLTESEPKTNQIRRRNNTPNTLRLDDKYTSKDEDKKINYTKIKINLGELKKGRHTASEIPHNYVRQKNDYNLDNNILNNINKTPDAKYPLFKNNSNSNFNTNYNRYNNISTKPREREYGTRTQNYSFNNRDYSSALLTKNEKEIEIYELPKYKDRNNYQKKISPKKYDSHSINYSLPKYNRRNFSVHTETSASNRDRNYLRNNEYEVVDVEEYKKNQRNKNINNNNNIREYNSFERGRINIRDNKKEIEKDEQIKNTRKESNHHKVYISSNLSSQNKKYKTSTQNNNDIRRNKYTLGNLNEYEVEVAPNNKYDKYNKYNRNYAKDKDKDKNLKNVNVKINKNNYFKEMKNLEEELEIDDNEQNEYVPPRQLFDNKNKKVESNKNKEKINFNINKYQRTPPSTSQNYLNNYYQPPKMPVQKSQSPKDNQRNINNINKNKNYVPQKITLQTQKPKDIKIIPKKTNLNKKNVNIKIEDNQEVESNEEEPENKQINKENDNSNKKPKYGSYFGDSNNNYYEVKGISEKKKEENEEEEEENDEEFEENENINKIEKNNYSNQIVRNVNFNIQSENVFIPGGETDKDEKEADEQQIEEDEQINIEENNGNDNDNDNDNNENLENNEDINYEDDKNNNENQIENNINKGNYVISNDNNIKIENNNNEMEQITEENMQEDGVDEGEAEGEGEEAMNEEENMVNEDKIEDKENLEGENEVDFDIDEEEAMNEEEMGNEEYNEYLEGEEIDDNIDEINENDEEEMMDNENDNDNEENNGE